MVREYIDAAMRHAKYEILVEDSTFYGEIEGFDGVYAHEELLERILRQAGVSREEWEGLN
jgi:hypothetical protein